MAANVRLKNEFTEHEKYHNLMRCLICQLLLTWDEIICFYVLFCIEKYAMSYLWLRKNTKIRPKKRQFWDFNKYLWSPWQNENPCGEKEPLTAAENTH